VLTAARHLVELGRVHAATRLEAAEADVVLDTATATFHVVGSPQPRVGWAEIAAQAAESGDAPLAAASDFEQPDNTYAFGCHLAVVEVDSATGETTLRRLVACDDAGTPIKAPVSVFDDVVYVGDEYGYVYALDAGSGEQKWKFETLGEIYAGVSLHEDRLLVGSYDNSLYCLDRASGEKVWQVETEGYVHGTPAVADGLTTVSGCDGFMWLIDIETGETVQKIDLRGQAASSPAVVGDMAYVATYENEVLGIDLAKRQVAWAYEHEIRKFPFYASAAADDEIVVIGGRDKIVHALDPATGERKWEWNSGARLDSSPVIVGDRVFLGSKRGPLLALHKATGEPVWEFDTGSAIMASPAVASERLVIGSLDGILYCFG